MFAGKFIDVIASLDGHSGSQSDSPMAHTQAELGGDETWIYLPRDRWPEACGMARREKPGVSTSVGISRTPSARCLLGATPSEKGSFRRLREHPNLGMLLPRQLKIVLSVYVDDFKMAGTSWKRIKTAVKLGEPAPFGMYLGCNRTMCDVPSSWFDSEAIQSLPQDGT